MTCTSQTGRCTAQHPGVGSPYFSLFPGWHASCIAALTTGCLYVEPAWSPEVNLPPELLAPAPDRDHVLDLNQFSQVLVTVREPDLDQVVFLWRVPDAAQAEVVDLPQDENIWASLLRVTSKSPSLDGQTISCTVVDEASPANRIEIDWTIMVEAP